MCDGAVGIAKGDTNRGALAGGGVSHISLLSTHLRYDVVNSATRTEIFADRGTLLLDDLRRGSAVSRPVLAFGSVNFLSAARHRQKLP